MFPQRILDMSKRLINIFKTDFDCETVKLVSLVHFHSWLICVMLQIHCTEKNNLQPTSHVWCKKNVSIIFFFFFFLSVHKSLYWCYITHSLTDCRVTWKAFAKDFNIFLKQLKLVFCFGCFPSLLQIMVIKSAEHMLPGCPVPTSWLW